MKKMLTLAVLAAIGLAVFGFSPVKADDSADKAANDALEKISSPDQIKYFKVIKKENGSLYGIRLSALANQAQTNTKLSSAVSQSATGTKARMEKILSPQLVNLYEKVQKIGDSLWGVKKGDSEKKTVKAKLVTAAMIECVSAAIDKKDEALKKQVSASAEELNAAIENRGECQKSAIKSTENQAANLQVCIKNFRLKNEDIMKQAKNEQKTIWQAYQSELKECAALDSTLAGSGELIVDDGGSAFMDSVLMK